MNTEYPKVKNKTKVGSYPSKVNSGGGYVWDDVLEYRVWCHPDDGSPDLCDGNDYYQAFANFEDALQFSITTPGAERPLALILQNEYIDEPAPGIYFHKKEKRITEWPMEFLKRPERDGLTILNFFAPDAPLNRLDIFRGII